MPISLGPAHRGVPPLNCHVMPVGRQRAPHVQQLWPAGGVHVWPNGGASRPQTHQRGHLVYAARGTLTVETERGTSVVPTNRVAWTPGATTHRHRAHGETDMRILFVSAPLAAHLPEHPTVLAVSDLAREALLTLTGPRSYDPAIRARHRKAQHRLLLVLLDELQVAPERPLELPRPVDPRLRALAGCSTPMPATTPRWRSSQPGSAPARAR